MTKHFLHTRHDWAPTRAKICILSLPNEIQLLILRLLQPDDFESLVLTCKSLHGGVAQSMIERHNHLRKAYRSFKFLRLYTDEVQEGFNPIRSVPGLLAKIAVDSRVADYIVHLDLSWREPLGRSQDQNTVEAAAGAIRSLVGYSSYIKELDSSPEFAEQWFEHIVNKQSFLYDEVDHPAAFLLSLLPNVQTLILDRKWTEITVDVSEPEDALPVDDFGRRTHDLIELVVNRANDTSLGGQSLSKLHTLHPTYGVDQQSGVNTITIIPFLALHSMRRVHHESGFVEVRKRETGEQDNDGDNASNSNDDMDDESISESNQLGDEDNDSQDNGSDEGAGVGRTGYPLLTEYICERYPFLGKNIEYLELSDYVMQPTACNLVLKDMESLKTLDFQYSMKDEYGYEWDIDGFVGAVMSTVGSHLGTLIMTAGHVDRSSQLIRSPMYGFSVLRHLELSTVFFVNGIGSVGATGEEIEDDWSDPIVPLIDILPPSLESFTLWVPCVDYECLVELCKNFKRKREEVLPRLKKVKLMVMREDCWGYLFSGYERQEKIVELIAAENDFEVEID